MLLIRRGTLIGPMAPVHAPSQTTVPAAFLDEVIYLLRRVVVHGEEQELLFKVVDTASNARRNATAVKSCGCHHR